MEIRMATMADLALITEIERECFPAAEAATREAFADRIGYYARHFLVLADGERLIGFINGMVTDEKNLLDEMYETAAMHKENGRWQMIFGLDVLPAYRKKGYAHMLMEKMIERARREGRNGVVLTCKESLLNYYARFGFVDEGESDSVHGGVTWHQMRLTF